MATGVSAGALGAAGKWFTALLTTSAAIVALLVNAQSLGITSWFGATELGFAGYAARRVLVTPRADSLLALGDTAVLAATVTDRRGAVLVGVPLVWTSDDTTVATVDSAGAVIARGPGLARITAEVREHRASATILVRQQVAQIVISGDTTLSMPEVDSLRVNAVAYDARNNRVRGTAVSWSSSDTFAVTVDSTGRIRSRAPGRAIVVASAGGRQGTVSVDVHVTPFRLKLVQGDGQHVAVGRTLPDPVTIEVLSRGGQPVPGAEVLLSAEHGSVEQERMRSDSRGRVQVTWAVGNRPGKQFLRGRLVGSDSVIVVSAESDPTPAVAVIELADSNMSGVVSSTLNPPVILRVTDPTGAPLPDVPVAWSVVDGGMVIPLAPRTDSLGQVIGRWTLGKKMGRQRLRVQVGDARSMPPTSITATATAGAPATLTLVSGGDQRVTVGGALPKPLVFQVKDSMGNAVASARFSATPSNGRVEDSAVISDASGRVIVRWTAGEQAGEARLALAGTDNTVQGSAKATFLAKPAAKKPVPAKSATTRVTTAKAAAKKPTTVKPR